MHNRPSFFLDTQICTGCKTCIIACKDKNDLPPGVRWRRVVEFTGGDWSHHKDGTVSQNVFAYYISVGCNHCREPICVEVCPTTAMHQNDRGIVTVDPGKCVGCRYCEWACPYSAPQFDTSIEQMTKCDFCEDKIEQGEEPACVAACPTRSLQFGEYDDLAIQDGSLASVQYLNMLSEPDPARRVKLRSDLLAYSERDTWAMVRIWQELWAIADSPA